jgi:hypothetical protein
MDHTDAQLARFLAKCREANQKEEQAKFVSSEPTLKCTPKTVTPRQMAQFEEAIREQHIEREKGGWRACARWLEQNCEEFRDPPSARYGVTHNGQSVSRAAPSSGHEGADPTLPDYGERNCPNPEPANETVESQGSLDAPEFSENACEALSAPLPIPPPSSAFWQSLLFGNPDALVSGSDATRAIVLVSDKLGIPIGEGETIGTLRAGQLRKMLGERFGPNVWDVMNKLWRSAPASSGAPQPNVDQSDLPPGLNQIADQPRWVRDLHDPVRVEREWLRDLGIGHT